MFAVAIALLLAATASAQPDPWSSWEWESPGAPGPSLHDGPGGPILIITSATNPFSSYLAEILRAEGFNEFATLDVGLVDAIALAPYDVAILGDFAISGARATTLTNWVNGGGNLIAMRPDSDLHALLGLSAAGSTWTNRYLLVNASGPGVGIVNQTIQYHGAADRYTTTGGATVIASIYSDATTPTGHAAVTLRTVGGSGGQAAAFTYDLARSVVYTRQGNPAWSGDERDGLVPIRSDDLFFGADSLDPQPDWVNLDKVAIPQADEQQRLLANLILSMTLDRKPLPRFWYFPRGHKAIVVMTGDDHGDAGMAPRFDTYLGQSPPGCSVDDWECVRATGYLYVSGGFSNAQAVNYHNQGFETALHVNTNCADWNETSLRNFFTNQLATFASAYPGIPAPTTNRTHCIVWSDWATQAKIQVEKGIRFDTNYYYWPPNWVQNRPGLFTGSGIPMRFADTDGTTIDCFQATTQMTDESGQTYPFTSNTLLDRALGAEGYYGAFVANMHFDNVPDPRSDAIVGSALTRGVPVVSSRQMLTWLDGRNASSFGALTWAGDSLSFTITVGSGARNLRGMVPRISAAGPLTKITRAGAPLAYTVQTIKGIEYAMFPADVAGAYVASYVPDNTPPVISNVVATPGSDGQATITWTTNEVATSRVDYGTSPALGSFVSNPALVVDHSIGLTGLSPGLTYHFRVTSADAAANSRTHPNPPAAPLTFETPPAMCFADDTPADFDAGSTTGTYVSRTDGGEVTLTPVLGSEFDGSVLPNEFGSFIWGSNGSATVANSEVTLDGTRVHPWGAGYGAGRTLEFVATFNAASYQHVGFGGGTDQGPTQIFYGSPWAIFSTGSGGPLLARTWDGGTQNNQPLSGDYIGTSHYYRIDWNPGRVDFWIDDVPVATHFVSLPGTMRPAASDFVPGGLTLELDWLHMSPFNASGTFESRVFDAGVSVPWGSLWWTADVPGGTTLAMATRSGDTPTPDGTWTAFIPVATSGSAIGRSARYIQYRVSLGSSDVDLTPVLRDVALTCPPGVLDVAVDRLPTRSGLAAARPMPFRNRVLLECALARDGEMTLGIYGVDGRRIRTLAAGPRAAGTHHIQWDGRDDRGRQAAAGIYFALLEAPDGRFKQRLVRLN